MVKESLSKMLGFSGTDDKKDQIREINVAAIRTNPYQPRKSFDPFQMEELAKSIKEFGLIQPIVVRKIDNDYELVAGERRLRAVRSLGILKIPAIVRTLSDKEMAEIALIENLQREDLNYFEEAQGYKRLIDEFTLIQEDIARRVGKSQSTIANKLRLLKLPEKVKDNIKTEIVTERHARALLKLPAENLQLAALKEIYENELNVRETDQLIVRMLETIEEKKQTERRKKIVRIFKDMRIYLNAIRSAVSAIEEAGLSVRMEEREHEEYIEVMIQIPKTRR